MTNRFGLNFEELDAAFKQIAKFGVTAEDLARTLDPNRPSPPPEDARVRCAPGAGGAQIMTDDQIKRVVFEHTKLNPNQADDQVLLDGVVRAVRELMVQNLIGYVHADGDRFMSLDIFDAWSKLRATPEQAAQYQPVYCGAR